MASNPYQSPTSPNTSDSNKPTESTDSKPPFSLQAAKFSLYSPFIMVLISFCTTSQMQFKENPELRSQISFAIGLIVNLTTLAALVLGVVGLIGGIQRRSSGTIAIAVLGVLLNGALVASTLALILHLQGVVG